MAFVDVGKISMSQTETQIMLEGVCNALLTSDSAVEEIVNGTFVNHYDLPCDCPKPTKSNVRKGRQIYSSIEWNEPSPYGWDYSNPDYYAECSDPEILEEFKRKFNDLRSDWAEVRNFHYDFIPADCEYCKEHFLLDDDGYFIMNNYGYPTVKTERTSYERWLDIDSDDIGIWNRETSKPATKKVKQNVQDLIGWEATPQNLSKDEYETWNWIRNPNGLSNDELWEVRESPTGKIGDGLCIGPNAVNMWKFNPQEYAVENRDEDRISMIMTSLEEKGWTLI